MANFDNTMQALGTALHKCRHLWQPEPFHQTSSPWINSEPELHAALMALSHAEVHDLLQDSQRCTAWLEEILPSTINALNIWQPTLQSEQKHFGQPSIANGIPGRKWQQINYFSLLIDGLPPRMSNMDWCSGKGYLSTTLAWHHGVVFSHCLELDKKLCHIGKERAYDLEIDIDYHCLDVLKPIPDTIITQADRHTALHACGGLHRSMLKQVTQHAEQIVLSPCCYHLYNTPDANWLSETGRQLSLTFDRLTLRIPLLETVTGGERAQRLRETEIIWRRAYESWRQAFTQEFEYRTLASAPKSLFTQKVHDFFAWAADQHGLKWDRTIDPEPYLNKGKHQFELSERLEIVRQGVKRFLEYYIVLDLACYLLEQNYQVDVIEFCPKQTTPRNLALVAQRY